MLVTCNKTCLLFGILLFGGIIILTLLVLGVREAHRLGVKAIEFDILLTVDSEPVVFHDAETERTTNHIGKISSTIVGIDLLVN